MRTLPRLLLLAAGLLLLAAAMAPGPTAPALAAPRLLVTEVPTAEPPTPTTPPAPPTATAEAPPPPTNTPVPPSATPQPTAPPADSGTGGGGGSPAATATPTAAPPSPTPLAGSGAADPAITKSVSPANAGPGDLVEYTLTVTNLGSVPAAEVRVEDTLPAFLSLEGASATRGEVTTEGATVRVLVGEVAPGEVVTITVRARVSAEIAPPANVNRASLSTSSPGDDPSNNVAEAPLFAAPVAVPAGLPNTAAAGGPAWGLALLGLGLIMGSLALRRRAR